MSRSRRSCPCGRDLAYADCCGAVHAGRRPAVTAEDLMRSRYSAYAVGDADYLARSWSVTTRPAAIDLDGETVWTGLEILGTSGGSAFHTEGEVDFRASFRRSGRAGSLRERSRFVRERGAWVYAAALA